MRHKWTALFLLLLGLFAAYVWQVPNHVWPASREIVGQAWNASGAMLRLGLLALALIAYRGWHIRAVCVLLAAFDVMVAGCSVAYLINPWPIDPQAEACSARLHIPLGLIGAVVALALIISIVRGKHERNN